MAILSAFISQSGDLAQGHDFAEVDPFPRLCAATDRLRRFAAGDPERLNATGQKLLEEALAAAAEAEQSIAVQRARIRYLESLSITDELTGLMNRRGFDAELKRALARAERQAETGVLILCDLDRFKPVNDLHGHPAGDEVLRRVARFLQSETRETDLVARLGGDEFALLFAHTTILSARRRCRRMGVALGNLTIDWQGIPLTISASFGMAPYAQGSQASSLTLLADQDLYREKSRRAAATA